MSAIGVIGEDETDCATVAVLIRRIIDAPAGRGIAVKKKYPPSGGSGKVRRDAAKYMRELERSGCGAVVLVHDLDRAPVSGELNDEATLRRKLEAIDVPRDLLRHICIPIEEIEAWFWSDHGVLDLVGKGQGKASPAPHTIRSPKEALRRLSGRAHHKPVYSTNDNPRLAEALDLARCAAVCPAFRALREFVLQLRRSWG